ncbi:hypothetical protein FBQ97_11955 [Acidobacteria bacterium ACD]|nr:MAG: hypothetical protein EDX89_00805 [Acidobacteriota bacterium]MDL1950512.1 hypothetical protein [Acidobacteria bacterium ACD]
MTEPTSIPPAPPAAYPPPPAAPPPAFVPPPPAAGAVRMRKSPGAAGALSVLPGLGHVYLGLYQRAVLFFLVWVVAMSIAERAHGPIGIVVAFWWFFVLIDAVRQANAINLSGAPESNIVSDELKTKIPGSLGFGVFLILVGLFFLIDRFVTIDLSFLWDWWPLLVIGFGGWQVFTYFKAKQEADRKAAAASAEVAASESPLS